MACTRARSICVCDCELIFQELGYNYFPCYSTNVSLCIYLQYYPEMELATKEQEGEKATKEREKQERKAT